MDACRADAFLLMKFFVHVENYLGYNIHSFCHLASRQTTVNRIRYLISPILLSNHEVTIVRLKIDKSKAEGYSNKSQIDRVLTEYWA